MLNNGHTYFKNIPMWSPQKFLFYVWPFFNIKHERINHVIIICYGAMYSITTPIVRHISWIIRLVRTQNFLKNKHFLLPDTHMYVCVSGGKKY